MSLILHTTVYTCYCPNMVLLIFFLLAFPIFILFLVRKNHKNKTNLCTPPGPKGLPLIGNLHQLDNSTLHRHLWQLSQTYGPLMSLRLGYVRVLVVSSAGMAKEVLKTHDLIFCSRPRLLGQQKLSYNGHDLVFSPFNDYWREMRKICVVHLFSSIRVQTFRPIREYEVAQMIEKMSRSAVANSEPVDLSEAMMSLTSTVICRIAFGKRYEEEGTERTRFQEMVNEAQGLFASFFFSDYFPLFGFLDHITGLMHRLEKNFEEFDAFYEELIKDHLDPGRPKPDHEDILDVLLQIWKSRSFKVQINFDHIKAILMNVFIAGTDTSAATVVWAMTLLTKNPTAMKKAQEEVRSVVGQKGFVDEDDMQKLRYLKAVIKETFRLQPTAPMLIPRESSQNCKLGQYEIPAKTVVYVNLWAIGRDSKIWKNSQDFIPERFVDNSIDLKGQDFELIPFGAGRRSCPGIFMGLTLVELALANLLYEFDWEMPIGMKKEDFDMEALPGLTMHKKVPLCLVPKRYIP